MNQNSQNLSSAWRNILNSWGTGIPESSIAPLKPSEKGLLAGLTPVTMVGNVAVFTVESNYQEAEITKNYTNTITQLLSEYYHQGIVLNISVMQQDSAPSYTQTHTDSNSSENDSQETIQHESAHPQQVEELFSFEVPITPQKIEKIEAENKTQLNTDAIESFPEVRAFNNKWMWRSPEMKFDNFVAGESNSLALSMAQGVTTHLGNNHSNPLFIWGQSGIGKTHLLNAIANEIEEKHPDKKIIMVQLADFMNDFIQDLRLNGNYDSFDAKYAEGDVLIVDDIQEIVKGDKEETKNQFFNIFQRYSAQKKQVIIASDRAPRNLEGLDIRTTSRLGAGMVADIQPPSFETRVGIVENIFSKELGVDHHTVGPEVIEYLASRPNTVREMTGMVRNLQIKADHTGQRITLELAKSLGSQFNAGEPSEITLETILDVVGHYYEETIEDLLSSRRTQPLGKRRQIVMYLAKELTDMSLIAIGQNLGSREHSTIKHGISKIEEEIKRNPDVAKDVATLKELISSE